MAKAISCKSFTFVFIFSECRVFFKRTELAVHVHLCDSAVSHQAVFFEQRPGDELQQGQQVDQTFLLQAQQTQHSTQLFTLHTTTLQTQMQIFISAARFWHCFSHQLEFYAKQTKDSRLTELHLVGAHFCRQ